MTCKTDPESCQWPFCGCDPAATRVLDSITDQALEIVPCFPTQNQRDQLNAILPDAGTIWNDLLEVFRS